MTIPAFYVLATLQDPQGTSKIGKDRQSDFPRDAYVTWDRHMPVFLGMDNPPKPVSREEAERLLSSCEKVHGRMYNHNLRIVPA
jgi:hypothetical protein